MTDLRVSLILCTIGRTDKLPRFLNSLQGQDPSGFQLIVVDQSPEGWFNSELAKSSYRGEFQIHRSSPGLSKARNVGLKYATEELVAFPDDDAWYPPSTVAAIISEFAQRPDHGVITGITVDATGAQSNGKFMSDEAAIDPYNVWFAGNSNSIFFRRSAIAKVGGFDESLGVGSGTPYGSGEETDLVLRALAAGVKAQFLPSLIVHHDQVDTVLDETAYKRATLYAKGFGRVLSKNGYPASYVGWRLVRMTARCLFEVLRGDFRRAKLKALWITNTASGYSSR